MNRRLLFLSVVCALAATIVPVASAQNDATKFKTFVPVADFVPSAMPVRLNDAVLLKSIDGSFSLKFSVGAESADTLSNIQFLLLVVDEFGSVRSGQGWRFDKPLSGFSSVETEVVLRVPVEKGNKIVLTTYGAIGNTKNYAVNPIRLLTDLSSNGLIKENKQFTKTISPRLGQQNPCAAAQTAAAASFKCGLKSFECNPQTGAYSFSCFSELENPSACTS